MRFKSIFWLFNIVVLLALLIFAVSSFFVFGKDYAAMYWGNMWVVIVLFVVLISILDIYFLRNWTLFDLLEKEDWPALLTWLDEKIYTKGRLNRPYASLLVNTALSVGQLDILAKLKNQILEKKPSLMKHMGVSLGIPVLKSGDRDAIRAYYSPLADDTGTTGRDWARWCRGMASGENGIQELHDLLSVSDISIRILAWDLLNSNLSAGENSESLRDSGRMLAAELASRSGDKALLRSREDHLMAAVLASTVKEARQRLPQEKND